MPIALPPLPYPVDALEPFISARTLQTHHGKHHRAYVDRTNALAGKDAGSLEEIIVRAAADPAEKALFNSAAQTWNHAFWNSLRPKGKPLPQEFAGHAEGLKTAAKNHFGSGWAWLVRDGSDLKVVTTSNADTRLVHGQVPLLVIDVWEHACYLDHQERRAAYCCSSASARARSCSPPTATSCRPTPMPTPLSAWSSATRRATARC